MIIVDARHWLDPDGNLPEGDVRLRRLALRVARFIECGGTLGPHEHRETLVECRRRPGGRPCPGLLWVAKTEAEEIQVFCLVCRHDEARIHGWQSTPWARGMMDPIPPDPGQSPDRGPDLRWN